MAGMTGILNIVLSNVCQAADDISSEAIRAANGRPTRDIIRITQGALTGPLLLYYYLIVGKEGKAVPLSWIMFALAAVMILLSRHIGKGGMLFPFLCVLFCCAGACVGVLCRASLMTVGTGTAAVLLTALLVPERSGPT